MRGLPFVLLAIAALPARADLRRGAPVIVPVPSAPDSAGTHTLVLERCASGCTVVTGANDALDRMSNIPKGSGDHTVTAFGFGDTEWAAVVQCVREVYSPYAIDVVETRPAAGTAFNEVWVAGLPQQIGYTQDLLGIAPLAQDCRVLSNVIAFVFANNHPPADRVNNICWTAVQESAHTFGLDHEYQFTDGASACTDPMTYRTDCGGEKFFRDRDARCGEDAVRDCNCKGTQDSHALLMTKFGAGTITTAPPAVAITAPADGTPFTSGEAVAARASAQRGVDHLQLLINGYPWVTVPGGAFGPQGQPEQTYTLVAPADVPDGNMDLAVVAFDDLDVATTSAVVHVLKGAPCVDASTCLTGQHCGAGKCFWDPPTGELGQSCSYPQFCMSGACPSGTCVETCDPASSRPQCGEGYVCDDASQVCTAVGSGCCSISGGGGWFHAGLGGIVLSIALKRRRRRTTGDVT